MTGNSPVPRLRRSHGGAGFMAASKEVRMTPNERGYLASGIVSGLLLGIVAGLALAMLLLHAGVQ